MDVSNLYQSLVMSTEPSVRYLFLKDVLRVDPTTSQMLSLQKEIKNSTRVQAILSGRDANRRFPWHAYAKWKGAFWTLLLLSELGYPPGDANLLPLRDQVIEWLFSPRHLDRIPLTNGRYRRCAVQEATALFSMLRLDLVDGHAPQLVEELLKWQWPDGGWNCDKRKSATHSSFHETWMPVRALWAFFRVSGDQRARAAAERASEIFLERRLFRRLADGEVMNETFIQLSYPSYWHYDILNGLRMMGEISRLDDPRCTEALDLLEAKRSPEGGFTTEIRYYRVSNREGSGVSPVAWGTTGKTRMNEFITVSALSVLKQAGRLRIDPSTVIVACL